MPELGMGTIPVTASVWHVEPGAQVTEGDRLLEVVVGPATVDLPSPATGTLAEVLVGEDEPIGAGQVLAVVIAQRED